MRFGILGYGGIAQRFVHDSVQVEEAEITWIASQTSAKREAAAAAVLARIVDNYQACLTSPEVDCVYIALPHAQHKAMTLAALAQHKHLPGGETRRIYQRGLGSAVRGSETSGLLLNGSAEDAVLPDQRDRQKSDRKRGYGQVTGADVNYCYDSKRPDKTGLVQFWILFRAARCTISAAIFIISCWICSGPDADSDRDGPAARSHRRSLPMRTDDGQRRAHSDRRRDRP